MDNEVPTDLAIGAYPPASRFIVWCVLLALIIALFYFLQRFESAFAAAAVLGGIGILNKVLPMPAGAKTVKTSMKATPLKILILLVVFGAVIALTICFTNFCGRILDALGQISTSVPVLFLAWLGCVAEQWRVQYKWKRHTAAW
jgi:hypothetical protein